MTSRERVLTALDHAEPDRIPIDIGGTCVSSIAASTYAALRDHMRLPCVPVREMETVQQIAYVDEDALDALGADVIPVFANTPPSTGPGIVDEPGGSRAFRDAFGATLRMPKDGLYYDWQEFPLPEPSIEAMLRMSWPDPADPARYAGLRERVQRLRANSDRALFGMAPCGHDLFNQLLRVRGMENGLMDLVAEQEFAEAFLERLTQTICTAQELFLSEVGDIIDVHFAADDLAGQHGPMISPAVFRKLIKPRLARIMQTIKRMTKAKVLFHCCGAVGEFLPDLIEIGVDILNPVQVSADGMDSAFLKRMYGRRLTFWGGGCDTQRVLGAGSPRDVVEEVRRRVADFAPGGGFVFGAVHNIQPFVEPRNIVAMFDTAREAGVYPIRELP
jgi:uroporphyrinogen decarboxylase